jgi:bifunctional UDP-N-acetylglucosamine pyrophosphorylase / glucosamine-1-phosphate N-acetyltransferase
MDIVNIVIMAAGKGTRMRSDLPKVLHHMLDKPLIEHVVDAARATQPKLIIAITGYGAELVESMLADDVITARQEPQLGTGHAVQQAVPYLREDGITVILNGDVPCIRPETIDELIRRCQGVRPALLTVDLENPTGYGRIVRDSAGALIAIVEEKDCTDEQRKIHEVYTGMMAVPTQDLKRYVSLLTNDNAQGEYYLTDIVKLAVNEGQTIFSSRPRSEVEVLGVNTPEQLKELETMFVSG